MPKQGFILHYKMRSDSCFARAFWMIKLYTVEFYFQFDYDSQLIVLILVSLFFFSSFRFFFPFLFSCDSFFIGNLRWSECRSMSYIKLWISQHQLKVILKHLSASIIWPRSCNYEMASYSLGWPFAEAVIDLLSYSILVLTKMPVDSLLELLVLGCPAQLPLLNLCVLSCSTRWPLARCQSHSRWLPQLPLPFCSKRQTSPWEEGA